jgi:transposase
MRKKFIQLSEPELVTLQEGHQHHRSARTRNRFQGLILSSQGYEVGQIAAIFSVIPLTVYHWFSAWEKKGLVGLLTQAGQGRKPILLPADQMLIKQRLQADNHRLKQVREQLKEDLAKEFSHSTLKRFLKSLVCDGNAGEKA